MRVWMSYILFAVGSARKPGCNCVHSRNLAGPAFNNKHPHLPRNEELPAHGALAADLS